MRESGLSHYTRQYKNDAILVVLKTTRDVDLVHEKMMIYLLLKPGSSLRETLVKNHLEEYETIETEEEQKSFIVTLAARLRGNEDEQWIWDVLFLLAGREPMNPILKDVFLSPLERKEIKRPKVKKDSGAPLKDPFEDTGIAAAVYTLSRSGLGNYPDRKACRIVAKMLDSLRPRADGKETRPETIRSIWKKYKNNPPFNRPKLAK